MTGGLARWWWWWYLSDKDGRCQEQMVHAHIRTDDILFVDRKCLRKGHFFSVPTDSEVTPGWFHPLHPTLPRQHEFPQVIYSPVSCTFIMPLRVHALTSDTSAAAAAESSAAFLLINSLLHNVLVGESHHLTSCLRAFQISPLDYVAEERDTIISFESWVFSYSGIKPRYLWLVAPQKI